VDNNRSIGDHAAEQFLATRASKLKNRQDPVTTSGTIAITVAPIANPISARRKTPLKIKWRTGEAGCCSKVANAHVKNMYNPSSPASIRYSGQCRRKLASAFIASYRQTVIRSRRPWPSFPIIPPGTNSFMAQSIRDSARYSKQHRAQRVKARPYALLRCSKTTTKSRTEYRSLK